MRADHDEHEATHFLPCEAWIEAFEAQATEATFERARRYAVRRALGVANVGGVADDFYVRELVQDAIADTLTGAVTWDPERCPLESHLLDVIRSRSRHDRVSARRFRRHALDQGGVRMIAEVEASLRAAAREEPEPEPAAVDALIARVMADLRAMAIDDPDVLRLLDAYRAGATKRADVCLVTGLGRKAYDGARKRMLRMVQHLSQGLRNAAWACL